MVKLEEFIAFSTLKRPHKISRREKRRGSSQAKMLDGDWCGTFAQPTDLLPGEQKANC